ncbi:OTU domain-containing protein 4 isoform X2 [Sceloporus undulatus]|uniref:OTU domain-containing protein 4 isoform X2 n=1 Tax=Sceloporus undulatus TaxID=8520 RepID=UPI001C4AD8F0|nr:OTU domain-containing protein 4 isoform X2 [Sceloporus undulatus]
MEAAPGEEEERKRRKEEKEEVSAMDAYLFSQGLYRKRVAKDGSCLFRAVAEQVFHSQSQHLDIRMACINYLRKNREQFEAFIEGSFEEYLKSLENPQEWVGQVEISALSLMYKKDFIIYQEPHTTPSQVTENGFPDKVLLCFSNGSHYDIVYPIEYTLNAALCQSILYELLYEKVFEIDVSNILEELCSPDGTNDGSRNNEASDSEDEDAERELAATSHANGIKPIVGKKVKKDGKAISITLPRKVLRALNASVYQNIEYEDWQQSKRDQQKRDFSIAAGMQYSVGDKCKVRLEHNGRFYNAHIQEVQSANGPVVVFVEELGAKHSVLLKNLKPLPQASPVESWNIVPGKKIKKLTPVHGQNIQTDADCKASKNPNRPIKPASALPPRLQGARQHHLSCPGMQPQQSSLERRTSGRNSLQSVRKPERARSERTEESTNRDGNYFGLSPEEHKEKQAVEEMYVLHEIQFQDEEAFPALSNPSMSQVATQTTENSGWRKHQVPNGRRTSCLKKEKEVGQYVETMEEKESNPRQIPLDQKLEPKISKSNDEDVGDVRVSPLLSQGDSQSPSLEQSFQEHLPGVNPSLPSAFPEMHLPPTVPSVSAIVPAWPNEPTTCGPTGVAPTAPLSSVIPAPANGLDSTLPPVQLPSSPVGGIPVPLQAVNQPLMPMPQTLNPFQDPLYPGFPLNEKGERVITPPFSLCSTGEDLPNDKNILRFFFNLGVKAYSCPMWVPHSYLYPLHQAYVTACRMYPKVPVAVYSHNPWMQELPLTQNGNDAPHTDGHLPVQGEVGVNGQSAHADTLSPSMPLFIPTAQVPESQGLVCVESENPTHALHVEYNESLGGKNIFPQPPFGQNPFLGPVPVFPPVWYGYPVQGYVENSVVRQAAVPSEEKRTNVGLPEEQSSPVAYSGYDKPLPKDKNESSVQGPHLPEGTTKSDSNALNKTSARVPREQQTSATPSLTQAKSVLQKHSTGTQDSKRLMASSPKNELKNAALGHKKASVAGNVSTNLEENRAQRPREESSEDECEVSDMLQSGRSKQFYNKTFGGGRRPRSEWSYSSGRGGYQYSRNEESWKGFTARYRDEGTQYHRHFRGRPYRHERRRSNMGDSHRGQQLS